MYKNVGGELKFWAKTLVVITAIPAILLGIIILFYGMSIGEGLGALVSIFGIVVGVVGYFIARQAGIMVYAFGELVERAVSIDDRLRNAQNPSNSAKQPEKLHTPPVQELKGSSWVCPVCDHQNNAGALYCSKCGQVR